VSRGRVIGRQFGESGGKRGSQVSMILLQPARKAQPDSISPPYLCCQSPLSTLTSPRATTSVSTINNCLLCLSAYIWFITLGVTMNDGGRPIGSSIPLVTRAAWHVSKSEGLGRCRRQSSAIRWALTSSCPTKSKPLMTRKAIINSMGGKTLLQPGRTRFLPSKDRLSFRAYPVMMA
jgi:hypothetical protein